MKKNILNAKSRVAKEKGDFKGWVKGVVYGPELKENKLVWFRLQEFNRVYGEVGGSTLVDLKIEGEKEDYSVLFHDMQYDVLTDDLTHIDFYKVKMGEKINTTIDLKFVNEAPAVKEQGGILVQATSSLDVTCFPRHLVSEIEIDISQLKELEDSIYVKDLKISNEIEITTNQDTVIVSISRPRTTEELEDLETKVEMDVDQVEVEKGGEDEAVKDQEEKPEIKKDNN